MYIITFVVRLQLPGQSLPKVKLIEAQEAKHEVCLITHVFSTVSQLEMYWACTVISELLLIGFCTAEMAEIAQFNSENIYMQM